jgi:hypothetical protein
MKKIKRFPLLLVPTLICTLFSLAQAQTPRMTSVNITPEADRVRIAAVGEATEMRVEVSDEAGEVVFQSGAITGNTLDWKMADSSGERVRAGIYLVTVTFRTSTGKLRKRVEQVTVDEAEKASTVSTGAPAAASVPVKTSSTGTVTANKIPKFASIGSSLATINDSLITQSSAGNIGIGTAAPAAKLHLLGTNSRLRLQSTATNLWTVTEYQTNNHLWHTGVGGSAVSNGVAGKYYIYDATANAFRMVIATDGKVGIGTTNPAYAKLHVEGGNGTGVFSYGDIEGVTGYSAGSKGVYGYSSTGVGVYGEGFDTGDGVYGKSNSGVGVHGKSTHNYAGQFDGNTWANGYLDVTFFADAGANTTPVCRNNTRLAVCNSSSLRYKRDVAPFTSGLNLIERLRPISFTWKSDGSRDFGLGAEDVASVGPFLVTRNERGEVEGVKYDRLSVVLINAIKEQQREIHQLRARLNRFERAAKSRQGSRRRSAR